MCVSLNQFSPSFSSHRSLARLQWSISQAVHVSLPRMHCYDLWPPQGGAHVKGKLFRRGQPENRLLRRWSHSDSPGWNRLTFLIIHSSSAFEHTHTHTECESQAGIQMLCQTCAPSCCLISIPHCIRQQLVNTCHITRATGSTTHTDPHFSSLKKDFNHFILKGWL